MSFREKRAARKQSAEPVEDSGMNDLTLDMLKVIAGADAKTRTGTTVTVSPNAITPIDEGTLKFRSFHLTRIGLQTDSSSYDDWMELGSLLRQIHGSLQWLLGDWIAMGEAIYGQTYDQIAMLTGYETKTLYEYAYVARSIQFSIRMENLSFAHHQLVAGFEPDLQRQWLAYATEHGLSVARMRQAMKEQGGVDLPKRDSFMTFSTQWLRQASKLDKAELAARVDLLRELLRQSEEILQSKQ